MGIGMRTVHRESLIVAVATRREAEKSRVNKPPFAVQATVVMCVRSERQDLRAARGWEPRSHGPQHGPIKPAPFFLLDTCRRAR